MSDLFFGSGRRQRHPVRPKLFLVGSKYQVFNGNAHHTKSGLIQADLKMNKRGHVVSRRASNAGAKKNPEWIKAIKEATRQLKRSGKKFTIKDIAHLAKKIYVPGPKRTSKKRSSAKPQRRRRISSTLNKLPTRRRVSRRKRRSAHTAPMSSALPSYSAMRSATPRKSMPRRTSRRHKPKTPYSP